MPIQNQTIVWTCFNTLRPRQNGHHFPDDTFKRIFLNENIRISTQISLKFVPKGPINNVRALVQIMAWRRPGDKPLSEPMIVSLQTHICVTRPQWVNVQDYMFLTPRGCVNVKMHSSQYGNFYNDKVVVQLSYLNTCKNPYTGKGSPFIEILTWCLSLDYKSIYLSAKHLCFTQGWSQNKFLMHCSQNKMPANLLYTCLHTGTFSSKKN